MAKLPKFENDEALIAWIEQNDTSAYMDELEEAEETFEVIRTMSRTMVPMPVTVEQIEAAVRQMDRRDRDRLFVLLEDLKQDEQQEQIPPLSEAQIEEIRAEVIEAFGGEPLSPDEPFLGGLTLGQFLDMPEEERAKKWGEWEGEQDWLDESEEIDVRPDALPAR